MEKFELIQKMQYAYIEGTKEHGYLCETRDCCTVGMERALAVALENLTLQDIMLLGKNKA